MNVSFCVEALEEALGRYGRPGIFNTGQESRFASEAFTEALKEKGIRVSMDGKGNWRDNVFVKRLCVVLSHRETGILSRCEFPDATDGGTGRDDEIDRRVHAELRDTAKKALLLPSRHAGQEAEFLDGKVGKRQARLEYVGLTPLTPDAEGKRVARDADGNVALRWKTESQFRARLQRWIFE